MNDRKYSNSEVRESSMELNKEVRRRKCGLEKALEDVKWGRVTEYESVADLIKAARREGK